jgi:hypothetical protein
VADDVARLQALARLVFIAAAVALILLVIDLHTANVVVREAGALRAELLRTRLQTRKVVTYAREREPVATGGGDGEHRGLSGVGIDSPAP